MEELVFKGANDLALTNTLLVAEKFGKEHRNVLQAVEKILGTAENSAVVNMFEKSSYLNAQGKPQPMYIMNRDGFSLLVMGFTGKKAMQFKIDYINAFNEMERTIKENKPKLSQAEFLLQQAQIFVDMERKQNELAERTSNIENEIADMKKQREQATYNLLIEPYLSKDAIPELSQNKTLRINIRRMVNDYSTATGISQHDVWHDVYAKLYYQYGKSVNSYKEHDNEKTKLDIAERVGLLPQIHAIISSMVLSVQKTS